MGNTWVAIDRLGPHGLTRRHSSGWHARGLWMGEEDRDERPEAYLRLLVHGAGHPAHRVDTPPAAG